MRKVIEGACQRVCGRRWLRASACLGERAASFDACQHARDERGERGCASAIGNPMCALSVPTAVCALLLDEPAARSLDDIFINCDEPSGIIEKLQSIGRQCHIRIVLPPVGEAAALRAVVEKALVARLCIELRPRWRSTAHTFVTL